MAFGTYFTKLFLQIYNIWFYHRFDIENLQLKYFFQLDNIDLRLVALSQFIMFMVRALCVTLKYSDLN